MRFLRFFLLSFLFPAFAMAQAASDKAAYQQYPQPPALKLTLPNGQVTTARELKKNKEMVVIVFSVDCDHCKHLTTDIIKNIDKFKNKQVLMITPFGPQPMAQYYSDFKIANYPTITMASEPTRQIMYFYNLKEFPGVYFYDKKGNLIEKHFEGGVTAADLLK